MFSEEIVVQKWQLNSISDLFNLGVESPNIEVTHIGYFLKKKILNFRSWELFQ